MDAGWAMILAAIVAAVGAIIVAALDKFRKENSQDHEVVMATALFAACMNVISPSPLS